MPDIPTGLISISLTLSQLQLWVHRSPPFPSVLVSGSMEELLDEGVAVQILGSQPVAANGTGWWDPAILYSYTDSQHVGAHIRAVAWRRLPCHHLDNCKQGPAPQEEGEAGWRESVMLKPSTSIASSFLCTHNDLEVLPCFILSGK